MTALAVEQFRYGPDNLGYLIFGERSAIAVDGGAVGEILTFLQKRRLDLLFVTNTHGHYDHTRGNEDLLRHSRAAFLDCATLAGRGRLELEGEIITLYATPGHTLDSLCFHVDSILLTGDTLFNGTVGNCFSGDTHSFYRSIKKILTLPLSTVIYAGHDYVRDSLAMARHLEPGNPALDRFLSFYDPNHVYSTLAEEMRINPYLRFNDEPIVRLLRELGLPCDSEEERWQALMSLE
ncbi:MBL fold metallo-hydrolase [Syntrophus buswellii]|uniref:MBL fold metallo-hydrolase n=1 Tax=Syntrophus buswellii TaxID=43774 RepID=UPI002A4DCF9A|nr:MBL fold metallo-hydrolase [Syntrophus sp. (in: bacteria)]